MKVLDKLLSALRIFSCRKNQKPVSLSSGETRSSYHLLEQRQIPISEPIGIIAGNGSFPFLFVKEAKKLGYKLYAVCHENETSYDLPKIIDGAHWIRLGQLGAMISYFKSVQVKYVAMAGGISRVKHFGDIKLDARGASLILRLRSTKDDVVMRGIAGELKREGIEVIPCTNFMKESVCSLGILSSNVPTEEQLNDIDVGISALTAISSQDIGQLVVVRDGVIVAVEAVEGSDIAIRRGAELGGAGSVVVKFAKPTQDMRFDVPTVGLKTIDLLKETGIAVLALEAGRTIILDKDEFLRRANEAKIVVIGMEPIVKEILA